MGYIPAFVDGKTIWVTSSGALLKVDVDTGHVVSLEAPVMPDDTTLAPAKDGLWVARWAGNKLYRLDPKTAEVQLDSTATTPVNIQFVGEDMWMGEESKHSMFKVDRSTGKIDPTSQVEGSAYAWYGVGYWWFVDRAHVMRIDPATKEVTQMMDLAGAATCAQSFGGTFPDSLWTGCFEHEVIERSVARIDPTTNTVLTVVKLPPLHGGGVTTIGDHTWFVGTFEGPDGVSARLIRIDPKTGSTDRYFSMAGVDPDGTFVIGDALWVTDEGGHRLLRFNLADLDAA